MKSFSYLTTTSSSSLLITLASSYYSVMVLAVEPPPRPSAEAAATIADGLRALLRRNSSEYDHALGSGPWGDRADLMGLLVRLPFHDAATFRRPGGDNTNDTSPPLAIGGSDGCVDLESPENSGLKEAIDLLEPLRETHAMSRADVWALAGNVMIESAGGPRLKYRAGRVDAPECAGQGERHVSSESTSSEEVERAFVDEMGLTHREVVALIGAHVLGRASRVHSGYDGPWVRRNDRFTNDYFVDMLHLPWSKSTETVEPFGKRTTWHRFEGMAAQAEIMLQTDVDLAFQTTGGWFCSRIGGEFINGLSCPNATHGFAEHVWEFAEDEEAWHDYFAAAWDKLTSMTEADLECLMPDCKTPTESWTAKSGAAAVGIAAKSAAVISGVASFSSGVSLLVLMWRVF